MQTTLINYIAKAVLTMRNILKYLKLEMKLSLRDPSLIFFVIIFPSMLLTFFASTIGDEVYGGLSFVDLYLPTVFMFAVLSSAIAGFSIMVNQYQSHGLYNLYRNKGVNVKVYIIAQSLIQIIFVLIGVTFALFVGKFFFSAKLASLDRLILLYGQIILACCILYLLGASFGLIFKSSGATSAFSMTIMFIIYFFSGMMIPVTQFNDFLRTISNGLITTEIISEFSKTLTNEHMVSQIVNNQPVFHQPNLWVTLLWTLGIILFFIFTLSKQVSAKR